jgi:fatty-acyl-CoA synthase
VSSPGLAQPRGLWAPLDERRRDRALLRVWDGGTWSTWSWDEWRRAAARFAGGLRDLGVGRGDRVACLLSNTQPTCAAVLGTWMAGGCLVSIPAIARGMTLDRYLAQLKRIVAQAEPALVLVEEALAEVLAAELAPLRVRALQRVDGPPVDGFELANGEDPVFVQYSSGSTSEPRGCVLSADAIAHQLTMLERALELDGDCDVKVDWLPLSHDMGLFGCLLLSAYWTGTSQVLSTPQRFLTNPRSWFADCGEFGATITCGPNFGLELTARFAPTLPPDPIPMRRIVIGGERIEPATLQRVCDALGPERLPRSALMPAYGLAEATLAVTMSPLGSGASVLEVQRDALAEGLVRAADDSVGADGRTRLTSVGSPLPGVEVDIATRDADVGEIRVRSASLATGYLHAPDRTAERFTPDGLLTGDIGFQLDGELYVTGRADDLLIVGGRNVYARDIEAAIVQAGGVRPGSCAVVSVDGDADPRLVALVEPADDHPELSAMAAGMAAAARASAGVRLAECVFLPRGSFPKTPSGKAQRFRCQELAAERVFSAARRVTV